MPPSPDRPSREPPSAEPAADPALLLWSAFPVDARHRPIVLTGPTHWFGYDFRTNPQRWTELDDEPDARRTLPAQVRSVSRRFGDIHTGAQLPVLRAVCRPAPFGTDRGPQQLPAWWLYRGGRDVPLVVLDPAARRDVWGPEGLDERQGVPLTATMAAGGTVLTVPLPQCLGPARVLENHAAVTVVGPRVAYPGLQPVGFRSREVTVRLARPLGARVLVDHATGCPIAVRDVAER